MKSENVWQIIHFHKLSWVMTNWVWLTQMIGIKDDECHLKNQLLFACAFV